MAPDRRVAGEVVGCVRSCTFVRLNRSSTRSNSLYLSTALSGVIVALVRSTKMPSKRASSASLPASISNALPAPVLRR